jgi:spore germination protein YaaH
MINMNRKLQGKNGEIDRIHVEKKASETSTTKFLLKRLLLACLAAVLFAATWQGQLVHADSSGKFNMSYIFLGSPQSYVSQVDRTKGSLNVISPSYFNLTADGNLKLSVNMQASFVDEMHKRGVKVVPFLSNEWDRGSGTMALHNREALSDQIAKAVNDYKLDGVHVNIENVPETERAAYTDLVRLLRLKLPASAEVSVAVPANPDKQTTGWISAYDLPALAAVSDYLMLMAYDESYPGDPTPGPVASLPFVKASIEYALTQIPANKLVLGIPFYGRYWNGTASSNGAGISNQTAEQLITKYSGSIRYDAMAQSPVGTFTIHPGDASTSLSGQKLPTGSYTVWYENEQSIKAKLNLVQAYGLKGSGSWSLNQETPDTWSYYSLWLNGFDFADVQGHWALPSVLAAASRGWMLGLAPDRFAPDAALTRAEAAAILVRVLGFAGETGAAPVSFTDVPAGHWARQEIAVAQQHGLIQGISDVRFAPDAPMTREQLCELLSRALGLTSPAAGGAKLPFTDVPAGSWSYGPIATLSARGLVDGFADGTFAPGAAITRAQMAALLTRVAPLVAAVRPAG